MMKKITGLLNNEKGEFGIKQIAATVAVIVIIGFAVTAIQGLLPGWITQIWNMFVNQIQDLIS